MRCINQVDGINDSNVIAEHFASHFERVCANSSNLWASRLKTEYVSNRFGYQEQPYDENRFAFDAELIETVILKMKRGKAAGLDGITCEHLLFSHPLLPGILAKLFNFYRATLC